MRGGELALQQQSFINLMALSWPLQATVTQTISWRRGALQIEGLEAGRVVLACFGERRQNVCRAASWQEGRVSWDMVSAVLFASQKS